MLKKVFYLFVLLFSFNALACIKVQGSYSLKGKSWKINQKVESGMEYIFPMDDHIFKMTLKKVNKGHNLVYVVQKKSGINLALVTSGEAENLPLGKEKTIISPGEKGHPDSLITIKLHQI